MNGFIYFNLKKTNMTYNDLPLYEAYIDTSDNESGMFVVSLVDDPAVERNFLAFNDNKKVLSYSIANEEQQKVFGLIMSCDTPIYRRDEKGFEYYITYNRKTIEMMAEKYFKMGLQNNVDTMHNFELEEGITLTQMFIKDSSKGVNPLGFEDVNDGSLFAEYHIENVDVWNAIKEGTFKGFSLAGQFYVKEMAEVKKEQNKTQNKNNFFMKINKFKQALRKLLAEFSSVATDKGTLVWDGDEDLKEGDAVHTVDEEGNDIAVEDGDYNSEDGKFIITVQDGKVTAIKEVEKETEEVEPTTDETDNSEEVEAEETTEPTEPSNESVEEVVEETPNAEIEALRTEIAELRQLIGELTSRVEKVEGAPVAKSAEEEFAAITDTNTKAGKMKQRGYRF